MLISKIQSKVKRVLFIILNKIFKTKPKASLNLQEMDYVIEENPSIICPTELINVENKVPEIENKVPEILISEYNVEQELKFAAETKTAEEIEEIIMNEEKPKRKRGRPRKNPLPNNEQE